MITVTFTISAHARGCVKYSLVVMNGQNISNDSDKGVQICIGLFIEPSVYQG